MKRVVSVSIGSSKRDKKVEIDLLGEHFCIERVGTDGDKQKAIDRIKQLDGQVDAIGLGGIDLYLRCANRRYVIRDAEILAKAARKTPVVDGGELKGTLERRVIFYLQEHGIIDFKGTKVLLVSGMDRFGMAEALEQLGADLVIGDLIFALGVPIRIRSLKTLDFLTRLLMPALTRLPFEVLYPTGKEQGKRVKKFWRFYDEAEVIAGDFHFIYRHLPDRIDGKVIITNTVTAQDVEELKARGARMLVTTTPEMDGRSFGTNVLEGVLISLSGKRPEELTDADYEQLLDRLNFIPRIEIFAPQAAEGEKR